MSIKLVAASDALNLQEIYFPLRLQAIADERLYVM